MDKVGRVSGGPEILLHLDRGHPENAGRAVAAGESLTFPDDASAAAGHLYLSDPVKLEQTLTI